ncbi:glycosyltransferase family 4 protein [Candidatus Falkowbacteria bacterium]|nr:MAG: glycosyltransferase family 4 protein [Candidatus Falkowbacteria bacterium]
MNALKMAMNILIDIRPLMDKRYSGVAEYTFELLKALLIIDQKNHYWLLYNSYHNVSDRLPTFDYPNVTIVRTKYPNKFFNYVLLKCFHRPLFDKLVGQPIDIFFMPHLNFARWSPSIPSIITVHDISFVYFPQFFNWRKNVWHWLLSVKKLLKRSTLVVTLSENTQRDVRQYTKLDAERTRTIYSGISDSFQIINKNDIRLGEVKQKYQLPDVFMLFLGTIEPRKNIEGLIKAFEIVKSKQCPDLKLVIAGGRGWKADPVYEAANKSSFVKDIIFLDYVEAGDKVYLYNLATLFVYPSFYEGFGFPPLEAMASGTPTIVSATSSLPEVVGDGAIMIDPYNPDALAMAISEVCNDESLRSLLSEKGKQQATKFNWRKTAEQYLELFSLISKK